MKKFFVLLVAVVAFGFAANAQNAIGLRGAFNGESLSAYEVTFQHDMGQKNRLEIDGGLSFLKNDSYIYAVGIYQWSWNIVDNLNWYLGAGIQAGYCTTHGLGLAVAGQVGIEYKFSFPLMVSADFRPQATFLLPEGCGHKSHFNDVLGLLSPSISIRYCF